MKLSSTSMILALICIVVIVLSLGGIVATVLSGITLNIDGIMLISVCLMMGGLFSLMLFLLAREEGWLPVKRAQQPAGAESKAAPQEAK